LELPRQLRLPRFFGKLTGSMKKAIAVFALLLFVTGQLPAWGVKGHMIVARLAESRLTSATKKNIRLLLENDDLAAVSLWADDIRKERGETFAWHFVDIPRNADAFSSPRDCFRPHDQNPAAQTDHHNCVVDRIDLFRQTLADPNASRNDRVEALKFLVHFVGDVHQPLHDVDEARGGNDIKVPAFGSDKCGDYPCNLHAVWDYSLIEHAGYSETEYVRRLNRLIKESRLEERRGGRPEDWANQSHGLAREILDEQAASVDEAYYRANIAMVDQQLALAGLRLAALLNDTLGGIPVKQLKHELNSASSRKINEAQ
jgi:hypothetical protein